VCAETCPEAPPGQIAVQELCTQRGTGFCVAGLCNQTDYACTSNRDCHCGCLYGIPLAKRQGPQITAIGCSTPCSVASDCPNPQPQNQCLQRDCWAGECMDVNNVNCDDFETCTDDYCEPAANGTAVCMNEPIELCCQQLNDCPDDGETCLRVECQNFNVTTGRGECVNVTIDYPCCDTDDDCVSPSNACRLSACIDGVCNIQNQFDKNCTYYDDDNDRCTVPICNATAGGECQLFRLSDELCPGACCLPNGTCDDHDMMDEPWCYEANGTWNGINTTCTPNPCDECQSDDDCEPIDKCHVAECEHGMCMQAPLYCNDNDPCTEDVCQPWTGQCLYLRDYSCCRTPDDCFDSGNPCTEPVCVRDNETAVSGTCDELNKPNCCYQNTQCQINGSLCLERICNHQTYSCETVGHIDCGLDSDDDTCTVLVCNNATGFCDSVTLPDDECPGACCMPDDGSCEEMDEMWCDVDNGFFLGINTTCSKTTCQPTPAPTPGPPTLVPTNPPTREPSRQPTLVPTREPSRQPTNQPTLVPTREPTLNPTREPTRAPPTPEPTFAECPPRDECFILGGQCQPIGVDCPPMHRSITGPCEEADSAEEPCCHCCVPCTSLVCPGHPNLPCNAYGPCSDYASEPPGEPQEMVCELAPSIPCWGNSDQNCNCLCEIDQGNPVECQPRLPLSCSSCEAPDCNCTRACGLDGRCACHVVDAQQQIVGRCDDPRLQVLPADLEQICACEERLACCFAGVAPELSCQLLDSFACEALNGTSIPSSDTCLFDTCPRSCRNQCDCADDAINNDCIITACQFGLCIEDVKLDCPRPACNDACAQRRPLRGGYCGGDVEPCIGVDIHTAIPFDNGHCACLCRGGLLQGSNAIPCDHYGGCPRDSGAWPQCSCVP